MERQTLDSPIGRLVVTVNDAGAVVSVAFREETEPDAVGSSAACSRVVEQLESYFRGEVERFDVSLGPRGTVFDRRVWEEVRMIPYGSTSTYRDIALRLGDVRATRAVGTANARNPIAIIVACHRVIGADGDLPGYAGGLWRKKWLLAHESGQQELDF